MQYWQHYLMEMISNFLWAFESVSCIWWAVRIKIQIVFLNILSIFQWILKTPRQYLDNSFDACACAHITKRTWYIKIIDITIIIRTIENVHHNRGNYWLPLIQMKTYIDNNNVYNSVELLLCWTSQLEEK